MDPILFWNDVALEANRVSFTNDAKEQGGPTLSSRAMAIVHLAMYDAYAAVFGNPAGLPPYLTNLPAVPVGSAAAAAVAAAAYTALVRLYPTQRAFFDTKFSQGGNAQDPGNEFGVAVARLILEDRKNDPGVGSEGYAPSTSIGKHDVDPDNTTQGFHGPFYGSRSKCFAVTARHQLNAPYAVGTANYKKAFDQVYEKGVAPELMGTLPSAAKKRTAMETAIGIFWAYDGTKELGTPPRLYNQIIRKIAAAQNTTPAENARLFALINVAMGDAAILAWEQKYRYEFWRPVIGIREDPTTPDTGWLPLGSPNSNKFPDKNFTPPFPAYPSGHATFGAACFHIAELYFGTIRSGVDVAKNLKFVSDELNGVNRDNKGTVRPRVEVTFKDGFKQMIEENGSSRVFLGVHWIFDAFAVKNNGQPDLTINIGGVPLGTKIADDIFADNMQKSNV